MLALLGVMAVAATPSVGGFLTAGKSRAFEADRRTLQAAVDNWRTDVANRATTPWPTVGGIQGALADGSNDGIDRGTESSVIKITSLSDAGYIVRTDSVKSFAYSTSPASGTGATNLPVGSYVWYVDTKGLVQGRYWADSATNPGRIDASELAVSDGFVSDTYP
ncbi:MAG: hypothetical protein HY528_03465 [Chloroflexi bacterium]|nr:hypothetical protein [Chloroflexota bacterium]